MKNLLLIQPRWFLKKLYPKAVWNYRRDEKVIYLTFDDGPIPELTEWVLDELSAYKAKATFFCVGANILKYNSVFQKVIEQGHTVANHTMFHSRGFQTTATDYLKETEDCHKLVNTKLFRPPYGQMKPGQYKALVENGYKIIMWDVISYDYEKIEPAECLTKVLKNTKNGSIVLFHDSYKAERNMRYSLPLVLKHFSEKGYRFEAIRS